MVVAFDANFLSYTSIRRCPWASIHKKTPSYWYRDPHYKPKTVWRPSQVYNGKPYTDKMASYEWIILTRPAVNIAVNNIDV